eukprot:3572580-Rhodomonas_salina.1
MDSRVVTATKSMTRVSTRYEYSAAAMGITPMFMPDMNWGEPTVRIVDRSVAQHNLVFRVQACPGQEDETKHCPDEVEERPAVGIGAVQGAEKVAKIQRVCPAIFIEGVSPRVLLKRAALPGVIHELVHRGEVKEKHDWHLEKVQRCCQRLRHPAAQRRHDVHLLAEEARLVYDGRAIGPGDIFTVLHCLDVDKVVHSFAAGLEDRPPPVTPQYVVEPCCVAASYGDNHIEGVKRFHMLDVQIEIGVHVAKLVEIEFIGRANAHGVLVFNHNAFGSVRGAYNLPLVGPVAPRGGHQFPDAQLLIVAEDAKLQAVDKILEPRAVSEDAVQHLVVWVHTVPDSVPGGGGRVV